MIMDYPYHFVALDDEQSALRRRLLDSYGQFAQLSILLIPLIYQLSYGLRLLSSRLIKSNGYQPVKEHQSPVVSRFKQPAGVPSSGLLARLRWALDEEIVEGWGTRKEWCIAGAWAVWLSVLSVKDTGDGM